MCCAVRVVPLLFRPAREEQARADSAQRGAATLAARAPAHSCASEAARPALAAADSARRTQQNVQNEARAVTHASSAVRSLASATPLPRACARAGGAAAPAQRRHAPPRRDAAAKAGRTRRLSAAQQHGRLAVHSRQRWGPLAAARPETPAGARRAPPRRTPSRRVSRCPAPRRVAQPPSRRWACVGQKRERSRCQHALDGDQGAPTKQRVAAAPHARARTRRAPQVVVLRPKILPAGWRLRSQRAGRASGARVGAADARSRPAGAARQRGAPAPPQLQPRRPRAAATPHAALATRAARLRAQARHVGRRHIECACDRSGHALRDAPHVEAQSLVLLALTIVRRCGAAAASARVLLLLLVVAAVGIDGNV
jgi:hypothetical protein